MKLIAVNTLLLLSLMPFSTYAGIADKTTQGDCSPIITGDVKAKIEIKCTGVSIPKKALEKLETYMEESYKTEKNLNDHIGLLKKEIADWEQKYKQAISQNKDDLKKAPDDPQLLAEQQALQAGELEKAAEIREAYYQKQKRQKTAELAEEAYTAAERWESAFNMQKALTLYQEAVMFRPDYPAAWRNISRIAKRIGNYSLALQAARSLQKQLDPEKDTWWLAAAFFDEGDALKALGQNQMAMAKYQQTQALFRQLTTLDPSHTEWQRDLSVSHNKVGEMYQKTGDNESALKAYEDGLAIAKKLSELDPSHTEWQRDLSVSLEKTGDVYLETGNKSLALKSYQEMLEVSKKLAELDPNVVEWQTDLVVIYLKLSQIQKDQQQVLLRDALAILQDLHEQKRLDAEKQEWIPLLQQMLE